MATPLDIPPSELHAELNRLRNELSDWQAWRVALVESLPFNLFWKDARGRFVFANSRFCRTLGSEWAQIYGKTDADFYPTELAEKYRCDDERVMSTGVDYFDIEQHKDPVGAVRWVEVRKSPLRNARGQTVGVQGLFRDVTDIKEAELALGDAEARYASLVESLPLAFWRKDAEGRFTFVNGRFAESVGRLAHEVFGKTDFDFFPKDLSEKYAQDDAYVLETGEVLELVEGFVDAGGQETFVQVFKAPLQNASGDIVGTQGIFWDVTSRERADRELKLAKQAAEEANRAKSQFLANMSHEIRTPLNGVLGMAELLKGTSLAAQQREYLQLIESSAESLLAVINDILDFSKVEAGKLELDPQPFALRDGLDDLLKLLAVRAHTKGIELLARIDSEAPEVLVGDANRLRQVLLNLLGNAIKFTAKGEVELRVDLVSADEKRIVLQFSVRDTGLGIAKDKQKTVFQAFEQADGSTTRRFGGTGLGLAIAARLVALMGGEIELESVLGKGSTFRFKAEFAPANGAVQVGAALPFATADAMANMPVLVVDDHSATREMLREMLASWGAAPTAVADAAEAAKALAKQAATDEPFRLVLIDAALPDNSGVQLAKEIDATIGTKKAARNGRDTRPYVVLLTSSGPAIDESQLKAIGVQATLAKPIKQSSLFDLMPFALESSPDAASGGAVKSSKISSEDISPVEVPARPLKVLVAEDNPVNQKLALGLLARRGHLGQVAGTGLEALEKWRGEPFDVIVMDVQMPIMDGLEATKRIREHEKQHGGRIPILAVTAHAMSGDRERCLAAGMDDYVSKPLRPQEFFAALERIAETAAVRPETSFISNAKAMENERDQQGHCVHGSSDALSTTCATQVLDWESALEHTGGDEDLLKEILAVFLEEYPKQVQELSVAHAHDDRATMRRVAHALKSGCAHVGAKTASNCAQTLESASQDAVLNELGEMLQQLIKALADVRPLGEARLQS